MKSKAAKIQQFLLQQQLPDDIRVNHNNTNRTGTSPFPPSSSTKVVRASDQVHQLALETCQCVHLQEYLPHILDLELARAVKHPRGYLLANPVHSLHLSSQLENSNPASSRTKQPPTLYGEEQQRTAAMQMEGIVEYWCPLSGYDAVIHDDTAVDNAEPLLAFPSVHGEHQNQPLSAAPSVVSSTSDVPALKSPSAASPPAKKQKVSAESVTSSSMSAKPPGEIAQDSSSAAQVKAAPSFSSNQTNEAVNASKVVPPHTSSEAFDVNGNDKASPPENHSIKDIKMDSDAVRTDIKKEKTEDEDVAMSRDEIPATKVDGTQKESVEQINSADNTNDSDDKMDNGDTGTRQRVVAPEGEVDESMKSKATPANVSHDGVKTDKDTKDAFGESKEKEGENVESRPNEDLQGNDSDAKKNKSEPSDYVTQETIEKEMSDVTKDTFAEEIISVPKPLTDIWKAEGIVGKTAGGDNTENWVIKTEDKEVVHDSSTEKTGGDADKNASTSDSGVKERTKEKSTVVSHHGLGTLGPIHVASTTAILPHTASAMKNQKDGNNVVLPTAEDNVSNDESEKCKSAPTEPEANSVKTSEKPKDLSAVISTMPASGSTNLYPANLNSQTATDTKKLTARLASSESASATHTTLMQEYPAPLPTDPYMGHLRREEDRIGLIRRSLLLKRSRKKSDQRDTTTTAAGTKKKRKRDSSDIFKPDAIPGWRIPATKEFNSGQEEEWLNASRKASETVERWIGNYRVCRETYWMKKKQAKEAKVPRQPSFYLPQDGTPPLGLHCQLCAVKCSDVSHSYSSKRGKKSKKEARIFSGDELSMCLECSFVGCSPPSSASKSRKHILQHLLLSGHKFAVTCGEKARIFCFKCGDFVYHEVFEQEKIRIDCAKRLSYMAWKDHVVLRSFDAFQFLKTQDHGLVWRGLIATYPPIVPREHFLASQLTMRRQALFEGKSEEEWVVLSPNALRFMSLQHGKSAEEKYKVKAPVGMYNHGNTCYMSSILQCLIFCPPLQDYFLKHMGHHHKACEIYRREIDAKAAVAKTKVNTAKSKKTSIASNKSMGSTTLSEICLACEMDRLFLAYFGSANGVDMHSCIEESCQHLLLGNNSDESLPINGEEIVRAPRGSPLMITDLLTSSWRCGGMDHLAGYEQRDAHEFLNAFLELLGKHIVKFRDRIYSSVTCIDEQNALTPKPKTSEIDIISQIFQGSLRSVLLCENCGVKRVQLEPFVNISLSLSEEVERMQRGKGQRIPDISVETCLEHFVLPEKLGDLVYCVSCGKKTETKKQHTFAKLPKILCLHLKRFDAAQNRKIDNFVSFPASGLNMGPLLSHWCEVTRLESSGYKAQDMPTTEPIITYDLFGTANHKGSMQSGHYISNVKVGGNWYSINDQTVCYATEESVLKADGAYVLFYIRKDAR